MSRRDPLESACDLPPGEQGGSSNPCPPGAAESPDVRAWAALFAILLLALLVRVAAVVTVGDTTSLRGDEVYYVGNARSLLTTATYRGAFRPPAQSALIASAALVFGDSLRAMRLVQVFVSLITVAIVFDLGRRSYGLRAAIAAGLLCAIHPTLISYTHFLWSETLYGAALALVVWSLFRFSRDPRLHWAVAGGLALGVAALTRETALYFLPVALGWIACRRPIPWRQRLRGGVVLVTGVALLVVPWIARNEHRFGIVTLSANRWRVVAYGNATRDTLRQMHDEMRARHAVRSAEREQIARETALRVIRERQPAWIFEKAAHTSVQLLAGRSQLSRFVKKRWLPPDVRWAGWWLVLAESVVGAITIALAIAGVWLTRADPLKMLVILLLGFHWAVYVVSFANPRFVVPLLPFGMIYGGAILGGAVRTAAPSQRQWRAAGVSLALYGLILAGRLCGAY